MLKKLTLVLTFTLLTNMSYANAADKWFPKNILNDVTKLSSCSLGFGLSMLSDDLMKAIVSGDTVGCSAYEQSAVAMAKILRSTAKASATWLSPTWIRLRGMADALEDNEKFVEKYCSTSHATDDAATIELLAREEKLFERSKALFAKCDYSGNIGFLIDNSVAKAKDERETVLMRQILPDFVALIQHGDSPKVAVATIKTRLKIGYYGTAFQPKPNPEAPAPVPLE